MKCVILQPSYVPWRGHFHQIYRADTFVFYDDVQYDKHGWRNRNRVKTAQGSRWLTIPVQSKGNVADGRKTNEIRVSQAERWGRKHWMTIEQSYGRAPCFSEYGHAIRNFYERQPEFLADFVIDLTIELSWLLGIRDTKFVRSSTLDAEGEKTDRLLSILGQLKATHYITGPAASNYLEEEKFHIAGIGLEYMTYDYPEYPQLYPPYDPQVSIVDLLFMVGGKAGDFIWGNAGGRE
jgi:hypothetical protein